MIFVNSFTILSYIFWLCLEVCMSCRHDVHNCADNWQVFLLYLLGRLSTLSQRLMSNLQACDKVHFSYFNLVLQLGCLRLGIWAEKNFLWRCPWVWAHAVLFLEMEHAFLHLNRICICDVRGWNHNIVLGADFTLGNYWPLSKNAISFQSIFAYTSIYNWTPH